MKHIGTEFFLRISTVSTNMIERTMDELASQIDLNRNRIDVLSRIRGQEKNAAHLRRETDLLERELLLGSEVSARANLSFALCVKKQCENQVRN